MDWLIEILKTAGPPLAKFILNLQAFVVQAEGTQLVGIIAFWVVLVFGIQFLRGRAAIPLRILAVLAASLLGLAIKTDQIVLLFVADAKSVATGLLIGLAISIALAAVVFFGKKKEV